MPYTDYGRDNYNFYSTGETYEIKSHWITCNTFNVIYVIQCRLCNLQYIGKTSRVSLSPRAPTTSKRLPRRQ